MRMDGCDSYKGKSEESNESEGLWIASPAGTPLAEAKHIYWFGSTYDAMAYYQLHQAKNKDLRKAVFISTGGKPIGKQMREILDLHHPLPGNISVSIIPERVESHMGFAKGDMPLSTFCHRGNAGEETLSRFHTGRRGFDRRRILPIAQGWFARNLHTVRRRIGRSGVDAFERVVCPGRRAGPDRYHEQVLPGISRETTGVPWY